MKRLIVVILSFVVCELSCDAFAQARTARPSLFGNSRAVRRNKKLDSNGLTDTSRTDTSRTPQEQREYKAFMGLNPSGTNRFGRTFDADRKYVADFNLKSFLGYEFGTNIDNGHANEVQKQVLEKPFRMFTEVGLGVTELKRLDVVSLTQVTTNLTMFSITNEVTKLVALFENQYSIGLNKTNRRTHWGYDGIWARFSNTNVLIEISGSYNDQRGDGELSLCVTHVGIDKCDREEYKKRKVRDIEKGQKNVSVSDDDGADALKSNVRPNTKPKTTKKDDSFGAVGPQELLEPALSLEEAVALAKKDDPRGYYQLAIIINQRRNWKDDKFNANAYRDYFFKKAVDAGYKNALFIDALIADQKLRDDYGLSSWNSEDLVRPDQLIEKYSGLNIGYWTYDGSLSSNEDVQHVLARYRKLEAEGLHQATNAIALLEWRVNRFKAKSAKDAAKKAKSDEMADLVRTVVDLPIREKRDVSAAFAKEAKKNGAIYLKSTEEATKDLSWDVDSGKPLYFELYDANEGLTRLLKFAPDGRLISVSPAE